MILKTEAKVGLVVFAAILVLIGIYWFLGGLRLSGTSYPTYAIFDDAGKLDKGADVRMAGVVVGIVESVSLTRDSRARVNMLMWDNYKIPEDSVATITKGGFIGDNYIEMLPGKRSTTLKPGSRICTAKQENMDRLVGSATSLLSELHKTAANINALVGDKKTIQSVKEIVESLKFTAESASQMIGSAQALANQTSPQIQQALSNLADASENAKQISLELQQAISTDARPNIKAILEQTRQAMSGLNSSILEAQQLIASFNGATSDVRQTLSKVNGLAEQAQHMMTNLDQASAGIKDIATDPELKADLKSTLRNTAQATAQASELMTNLNRKIGSKLGSTPTVHRSTVPNYGLTTDGLWNTGDGKYRFDANYTLASRKDDFYRVGGYNIGDNTRLNLEAGRVLDDSSAFRYGIYASRVAIGYDRLLGRTVFLSADLFNPNDPEMEVRGVVSFGKVGLYGGLTDVFDGNNRGPLVGIRYQK